MKAYIECKFSPSGTEMETAEILNIGHRKHANEAIIDFIDRSLKISFKDNIENNITGAAVIGEVGAGKSQFLKGFTRKINKGLIKGKNIKAIALYVSSDDYLELCKENANITQIFISAYKRILEKRTEDDFLSKEKYANGLSENEIELLKQRLDDKANKFINNLVEFFKDLGYDRVFLMVDELENLVKVEDINHSAFIADIKSFLTGYKIRNYVSIVIACSRAAWKEFATITELFDPAERRLVEIVLKRFSREEAFQFVEKSIIGEIPFTTGAVRTLWNASRGLPGDLSSLCYFAIEKASKDMEVGYSNPIDYAIVLDTIKNYPLRIGEEEINAINDSALQLIENSLKNQGENYLKVFQKLIGEIKEYTIEELSADLDLDDESLRKIIGYLHGGRIPGFNAKLVTTLYEIKDINQANNALLEYGLIDEDSLRNTNLKVDKLFKELSAYSLDGKSHYLPIDPEDLARRVGIKPDFAKDIINSLRDYPEVLGNEIFYRISEIAKYRLFPPPAEESLSFIKTFKERQRILDKFTSSFGTEEGDSIFLNGFLEFCKRIIGIKIIRDDLIELKHWGVSLHTKVFAVSGREVNNKVIQTLQGTSLFTHHSLLLCLHNGPITQSAEQILKQRDQAIGTTLRDRFLAIKIDEELSKTLVSLSLLRNRELPISSVKEDILSERIEEMKKALDINNILIDWYDKAKNSGIILQTWPLDVFGGKTTDFHNMYEMILCSYNELPIKRIEKIYNKAREVEPDLEPKTLLVFNTRFESLLKFGIIKRTDKGYELVITPVEKLIMQIISNKRTFEIKDISSYFINFDTALSLNAKLAHYLKLLELKGILKREKSIYEVVKIDEAIPDCKRNYEKAKELYDNSNKDQGYGGQYIAYDYDIKKIMEKIEYYYKLFQQSQYIHIPTISEDLEQSPKVLIPIRKISELLNNKKGLIEHYNNAKDTFLKAVHLIENAEKQILDFQPDPESKKVVSDFIDSSISLKEQMIAIHKSRNNNKKKIESLEHLNNEIRSIINEAIKMQDYVLESIHDTANSINSIKGRFKKACENSDKIKKVQEWSEYLLKYLENHESEWINEIKNSFRTGNIVLAKNTYLEVKKEITEIEKDLDLIESLIKIYGSAMILLDNSIEKENGKTNMVFVHIKDYLEYQINEVTKLIKDDDSNYQKLLNNSDTSNTSNINSIIKMVKNCFESYYNLKDKLKLKNTLEEIKNNFSEIRSSIEELSRNITINTNKVEKNIDKLLNTKDLKEIINLTKSTADEIESIEQNITKIKKILNSYFKTNIESVNLKIQKLQTWTKDYSDIIMQIENAIDSALRALNDDQYIEVALSLSNAHNSLQTLLNKISIIDQKEALAWNILYPKLRPSYGLDIEASAKFLKKEGIAKDIDEGKNLIRKLSDLGFFSEKVFP